LERGRCEHVTCAAGDLFGDGRTHFVTGSFHWKTKSNDAVTIWRNMGSGKSAKPHPP
jgi:hypothetical protein